jgi:hypothetical protein
MDKQKVLEDLKIEVEELEERIAPFWSEFWGYGPF